MDVRGIELLGGWREPEVRELRRVLAPLPRDWVENNPSFRQLVRRAVLTNAPPEAPGHSKYEPELGAIVVFDKGVYHGGKLDPEQFRRSIYHELAHSIIRRDPQLLRAWTECTRGDGFVDNYAKTSPDEDFADTLSEFFIHNGATTKVVPAKASFLRHLLEQAEEKVAMSMLDAFTDELTKIASKGETMKKLLEMTRRFGGSTAGKATMGAAGGGGLGLIGGHELGETAGYKEGTEDLVDVAQKARRYGQLEGVRASMQYMRRMQEQRRMQGQG
jgi:hypothetical protein